MSKSKNYFNPANPNIQFDEAASLNNITYLDYYKRLRLLAISMFKWENLPDSMNERFLERTLYTFGLACFIYDDTLGYLNLKCLPSSSLNVYEEATQYTAWSINYNKVFDRDDIILVRNNYDEIPTDTTIQLFARRLAEAERTIDVNIKAQKTPVFIRCTDKERLTMKNLYMQYDGNQPFIFGSKDIDVNAIEVLKTDAPFVADKIMDYKKNLWSEAMSFLGINNVADEKNERLITDEVNANNQMIQVSAQTMLLTRKEACAAFNKKFGFDIDVHLRSYDEIKMIFNSGLLADDTSPDDSDEEGEADE